MRQPIVGLALLAAIAVLVVLVLVLATPGRSATAAPYRPLDQSELRPFPLPAPVVSPTVQIALPAPWPGRPAMHHVPAVQPGRLAVRPPQRANLGRTAIAGRATWYCLPGVSRCMAAHPRGGLFAAAGPALRAAIGPGWRNRLVTVCHAGSCISGIRLADWCRCPGGHLIDLYSDVFDRLGPLGSGVMKVEVHW